MIETADLQAFLEKIQGGTIPVDLLKIGQAHYAQCASSAAKNKYNGNGKFRIALDIEDCLDRFYGGYYSDWACGGQWNRAYEFVRLLIEAFSTAHIELIVFFDGSHQRYSTKRQNDIRQKAISVLKHIRMIGTPPPKIWWLPPSGLRTCLRNTLRSLNILVIQTVHEHTMEVIDYFHEYKLDGILGLNPDYVIANTSKYYSSHDLRLSYKGALETKEYLVSKLLTNLSLTPDHLPFMAIFLGGLNFNDETILKSIYKKITIDYATDFEVRIRKIAEIVRNSPTNEIDEFIRHLDLTEWSKEIKETVNYYKRTSRSSNRKLFSNKRKVVVEIQRISEDISTAPLASETNETDEIARKMLQDVNSLVDDSELGGGHISEALTSNEKPGPSDTNRSEPNSKSGAIKKHTTFVYALPGEVLKTSLNRHHRGIMDSRIYQLLTKKEIVLTQILEDEQYRDIPSIHLFYRSARQMIYAILFNLYHQKYLYSKALANQNNRQSSSSSSNIPEVLVSEWIWSPQNEYKKPNMVPAVQLPWAVPTIQRLWFGMAFEDKERRMKAFLTVMRSDTPLMLNRNYVPHHLLVLACVLRYIITSPDRKILSRLELDAFLVTAFSTDISNVEYTQELVLPGVHLRGVYLATLFMQGVETASLANDACGVPLPWVMTNPWLFFDGKLFHFKLKMSTFMQLRDLCDNQLDIVVKVDRLRKAILEDAEQYLIPAHMDPLYRSSYYPGASIPQAYGKNSIHPIVNIPQIPNGSSSYYNSGNLHHVFNQSQSNAQNYFNHTSSNRGNGKLLRGQDAQPQLNHHRQQHQQQQSMMGGYQLKVGGVVVGSWAGGAPNRNNLNGNRVALATAQSNGPFGTQMLRYPNLNARNRVPLNNRLQRNIVGTHQHVASLGRTISRNTYGSNKVNRNRNRNRNRKNERKTTKSDTEKQGQTDDAESDTVQDSNGTTTTQVSNLAKSMCHEILKEEEEDDDVTSSDDGGNDANVSQCHKDIDNNILDEQNGNKLGEQFTNLNICDNNTINTRSNGDMDTPEKDNGNNSNITTTTTTTTTTNNNNKLNNKKQNLKQTKKGMNNNNPNTNSNNNSKKLSTSPANDLDANDTNDNNAVDDCNNDNDQHLAHTNDLINDDVTSVQA